MADATGAVEIDKCQDEETLTKLLSKTEDFDKRKQIRARLKILHEEQSKAFEEKKKAHVSVDPVAMRAKQAEEAKARQMKGFQEMAKFSPGNVQTDDCVKARAERSQKEKEAELKAYGELAKVPGVGALQGGSERVRRMEQDAAAESKARQLRQFDQMAKHVEAAGTIVVNEDSHSQGVFEHTVAKDAVEARPGRQPSKAQQRPKSAMDSFKSMDKSNNPEAAKTTPNYLQPGNRAAAAGKAGATGVTRNPSQIKQMLLEWCMAATRKYNDKGVSVTNFGSSWSDGLAFCALIHNFHPEAFNFDELSPADRRKNFELAFNTAEKFADIAPLLDVEDMMKMKTPDWKCVFTYVQSFYRKFRSVPLAPAAAPASAEKGADADQQETAASEAEA